MGDKRPTIAFNRNTLRAFRAAYEGARKQDLGEFEFEGQAFLVSYAYYLIEYLETQLAVESIRNAKLQRPQEQELLERKPLDQ